MNFLSHKAEHWDEKKVYANSITTYIEILEIDKKYGFSNNDSRFSLTNILRLIKILDKTALFFKYELINFTSLLNEMPQEYNSLKDAIKLAIEEKLKS